MQVNNNREEEMEIDLRDCLVSVMRHWRRMLVFGVIVAVLFGGYRLYKSIATYRYEIMEESERKESAFDIWKYEQEKAALEERITRTEDMIQLVTDYQNESPLMNYDPYDYYWASVTYYVTTNYQIIPEFGVQDVNYTDSVLAGYSRTVVDNELYDNIREVMGLEADDRYVSEMFRYSVDYSADMITVEAVGATEADARKLLNIINDKVLSVQNLISKEIHEHEINSIVEKTEHINYDDASSSSGIKVKSIQQSTMDRYLSLNQTLIDLRKELDDLEKDSPVVTINVSGVVKYVIVGFVGGMCLVAFFFGMTYILGGSIKTEDELDRSYGLPVLGINYRLNSAKNVIDKRINHFQYGNLVDMSQEQFVAISSAKLSAMMGDSKESVALAGTLSDDVLKKVFDELKAKTAIDLEYAGNPLTDTTSIEKISSSDHVLVVERLHSSKRSEIRRQMEMLNAMKKDVLGILLV